MSVGGTRGVCRAQERNVQASGGGASGFVSLGALMLGSAAVRHARGDNRGAGDDRQAPPPPDTSREPRAESVETDSLPQGDGNSE